MIKKIILFILLNFAALAIGSLFTESGVSSNWYQNINKAPWTPPGWVFGFAWTTIMICFAVYMAFLFDLSKNKKLVTKLYVLQLILNMSWNPIFFYFREFVLSFITISSLTVLIALFFFRYRQLLRYKSILITPYLIWLIIACSLNGYILFNN